MSAYLQIFGIVFGVITALFGMLIAISQLSDDSGKESWWDLVAVMYLIACVSAFIAFIIWVGES